MKPEAIMFGADWCPDCRRTKAYLEENGFYFQFIDIDRYEWAAQEVESINNGKRIIPTLIVNGTPITNPDNSTLMRILAIAESVSSRNVGGNAFVTKTIENYPGFTNITGPDLMNWK